MAIANRFANLGVHLGLRCGPLERLCSLDTRDYKYPTPTAEQQEALMQQAALLAAPQHTSCIAAAAVTSGQVSASLLPATVHHYSLSAAAVSGPGSLLCKTASQAPQFMDSTLPVDLDEDCLKLMLGEDGDEPKQAGSSSSLGGFDQSSRKALGAGLGFDASEEDDAVDLLFQDLSMMRRVSSFGELDQELLQSLQHQETPPSDPSTTTKRAKVDPPPLMLSMNYNSAAATINRIMETEGKPHPSSPSASQAATPSSPSAASAETTQLERSCSVGKRKRGA